jgi:diguanylate cyclase (GGDEF)-like protein/PAS domain S-box-containing protein
MSVAGLMGATAGTLLAACAVVSLWLGPRRQAGTVRAAYWWFAVAAVLACVNLIVGQAALFPAGSAAMMLSFADLPGFLVLPALATGLGLLASAAPAPAGEILPSRRSRRGLLTLGAYLVDGYLMASALFLAGWVAVFGPVFTSYADRPATFAAELVHPLADLVFIAATLAAAGTAGRRGTMPYLALVAVTIGDSLMVGARITGSAPGAAALAAQLAVLALLALAPWGWSRRPAGFPRAGGALWVTTGAAAASAAVAAVLVTLQAVVLGRLPQPVVLLVLGITVVALGARVVGLVRRVNSWARVWQESGRRFRQLADRTSDAVLICDLAGVIRYASRAVADYGYTPDSLTGLPLAGLLHPEDRAGGYRVARRVLSGPSQGPAGCACRVRAADGTWRHVESTISRYRDPGGPDQLLVTARDVSAQVELRRQVTHLTFHDPLTGLPNRAYIEQRTAAALGPPGARAASGGEPGGAVAIMLCVDGFAALNDAGGRGAGDLLLTQIARRLRVTASPQDVVARWGGEEFAVLIEGLSAHPQGAALGEERPALAEGMPALPEGVSALAPPAGGYTDVLDVAERLARSVPAQPFRLGDDDVTVTVSAGVAVTAAGAGPGTGGAASQLWRNAELAMARARELGGNRVEVFGGGPGPGHRPVRAGPGEADPTASAAAQTRASA